MTTLSAVQNRSYILAERPSGRIDPRTFRLTSQPVPDPGPSQALVRVDWMSLDPSNRAWINSTPTYLPPVGIGEVMRGWGLGTVIASNNQRLPVGTVLQGLVGWQEYALVSDADQLQAVHMAPGVSPSAYLGVLGKTGLVAWVGVRQIGRPQAGETFLVSAASGAVGSVAGQLAKASGARVVGIAGGPAKCAMLVEKLGFDAAVDYQAGDWADQLVAATPDGIDVDFESVGGPIMDAVFARLNIHARVALCGMISGYNSTELPPGPANFSALLTHRVTLQGFTLGDHYADAPSAATEIGSLLAAGRLIPLETVIEGFEQLPVAINMLFEGTNVGKLVVKLAH